MRVLVSVETVVLEDKVTKEVKVKVASVESVQVLTLVNVSVSV